MIDKIKKEPHYTKRNAIFDECVKNCDTKIMKKVSDEIDKMLEKEKPEIDFEKEYKEYVEQDTVYSKLANGIVAKAIAKHFFNLGKYPSTQDAPKIKGWVARDYDNEIFFHCKKPQKFHEDGIEYWGNGGYRFMIPKSMQSAFFELCTTDEPIEVELTIHRV